LEGEEIAIMASLETVAEKTVSYGVFRLAKHYADLAFASDMYETDLIAGAHTLRDVARKKLESQVRRFPSVTRSNGISDFPSLEPAFVQDHHLRVVKFQWDQKVKFIGAAAEQYTFAEAKDLVTQRLVPLLFPNQKPHLAWQHSLEARADGLMGVCTPLADAQSHTRKPVTRTGAHSGSSVSAAFRRNQSSISVIATNFNRLPEPNAAPDRCVCLFAFHARAPISDRALACVDTPSFDTSWD
jgi:hypothetical protein